MSSTRYGPRVPTFVVGFNPVPMANAVATLASSLRRSILWTLVGAGVMATGVAVMLWWRRRDTAFWRERPSAYPG